MTKLTGMTPEEYRQCLVTLGIVGIKPRNPDGVVFHINRRHVTKLIKTQQIRTTQVGEGVGLHQKNLTKKEFDSLINKHLGIEDDS